MSNIKNNQSFDNGTFGSSFIPICSLNINGARTIVSGSTSGQIEISLVIQGSAYKKVMIYCNNLVGTATYTYTQPFLAVPIAVKSSTLGSVTVTSSTATAITLTGTLAQTGFFMFEGL